MRIAAIDEAKLARTGEEYLQLLDSDADWIVRTPEDVQQLRKSNTGAFAKLSDSEFEEFAGSLEFHRGGVSDGRYKPLMNALSSTELFEIFTYFGMSRDYFLRIHEYECQGGWHYHFGYFCASNCAHAPLPPEG